MATPRTKIELFYDVVSPYSWVAFEELCRYRNVWNIDLQFRPFYLGGIMQAAGNKPPAMVPLKGAYMMKDVDRLSKYFRIPLQVPENFQQVMFGGTINAMRLLTVISLEHPDKVEALTRELWMRVWSRQQGVKEKADLQAALAAVGLAASADQLIAKADDARTKEQLKTVTNRAAETGAFGAPWILIHLPTGVEAVFGSDRFHVIAHMLNKSWPVAAAAGASKL